MCAETSPDAFAVYSAAIEANASKANELTAGLKTAMGEDADTIGIRTKAITLMSDAKYRLSVIYNSAEV